MKLTSFGRALLCALTALAACVPATAQLVTQTGAVAAPNGQPKDLNPSTIFNQSCNGGAGGIVGQTYSGSVCSLPNNASILAPSAWAGAAFDARAYGSVTITVATAPTTAQAMQWSADNGVTSPWTPVTCIDLSFNTSSTIASTVTPGSAYVCQGGGYLRLNGGSGGTYLIGAAQ